MLSWVSPFNRHNLPFQATAALEYLVLEHYFVLVYTCTFLLDAPKKNSQFKRHNQTT